jgi:hypothetical protein
MGFGPIQKNGDPDRIRTCDLQIRNLSLYPTELRDQDTILINPKAYGNAAGPLPCCQR